MEIDQMTADDWRGLGNFTFNLNREQVVARMEKAEVQRDELLVALEAVESERSMSKFRWRPILAVVLAYLGSAIIMDCIRSSVVGTDTYYRSGNVSVVCTG